MYLDPRGGTQPLSGLSMRPSIQQAGLHNMPGVQMPASFAEAVANGVNARAQRMSVNVAAGRPMPATMGDANAEANVPGGGVEAFMANMIDQALDGMMRSAESMADRVQSSVTAVSQANGELTDMLTQILQQRIESGALPARQEAERLRDMLQRHRDERRAAMDRDCLLYTSPSPRDKRQSRMPSSA